MCFMCVQMYANTLFITKNSFICLSNMIASFTWCMNKPRGVKQKGRDVSRAHNECWLSRIMCQTFHEIEIPIGLVHDKKRFNITSCTIIIFRWAKREKERKKEYFENIKVFCIMYIVHTGNILCISFSIKWMQNKLQ